MGAAGSRMRRDAIISLTLPGDPLFLPAPLPGTVRSPPGEPSARRVSCHCHSEERRGAGGKRRPRSRGELALPLLPILGQHWPGWPNQDGCVRVRSYRCCPLYPPRAFTRRTETCRQGCPVPVMLPPCLGRGLSAPSLHLCSPLFFLTLRRHRKRERS